jgi:hypothetical protein
MEVSGQLQNTDVLPRGNSPIYDRMYYIICTQGSTDPFFYLSVTSEDQWLVNEKIFEFIPKYSLPLSISSLVSLQMSKQWVRTVNNTVACTRRPVAK